MLVSVNRNMKFTDLGGGEGYRNAPLKDQLRGIPIFY